MSIYVVSVQNFITDRHDDIVNFVLTRPITALIYSISMKILGFYCSSLLYPLGTNLFWILLSSSIIIDITMLSEIKTYKRNLITNIEGIKDGILLRISQFYNEHITDAGRAIIQGFFFREH